MAILPNPTKSIGDRSIPTPSTTGNQQPKALTIDEYKRRLARKDEERLTRIPTTAKPKHRRAGKIVALRRRLADLKSRVNSKNTPPWDIASKIWLLIIEIQAQLEHKKNKHNSFQNH